MAFLTTRRGSIVVVAIQARTHASRSGSEPRSGASQTLRRVSASETPVVAGLAGLVHSVVKVPDSADAVLVDLVKKALKSGIAGGAFTGLKAGGAGVVTLDACNGDVVIVKVLGAGAPVADHGSEGGIAGGALLAAGDAGQTGVGAGQAKLVAAIVVVVVGADAETCRTQ
jgi:hypothetical protein